MVFQSFFRVQGYFGHFLGFQRYFSYFLGFKGYVKHFYVYGVFRSFFRFRRGILYFGLFKVSGVFLVFFLGLKGVFRSFFRFRGQTNNWNSLG